jgi:hypothetical protein
MYAVASWTTSLLLRKEFEAAGVIIHIRRDQCAGGARGIETRHRVFAAVAPGWKGGRSEVQSRFSLLQEGNRL